MGMGDELGQIKEGYLADLLLVDGDPIANVRILQDKNRMLAIMKDGKFHKAPRMQRAAAQADRMSHRRRAARAQPGESGSAPSRRHAWLVLWLVLAAVVVSGCSFAVWPDLARMRMLHLARRPSSAPSSTASRWPASISWWPAASRWSSA